MNVVYIFSTGEKDTLVAIVEQPEGVSPKTVFIGWLRSQGFKDDNPVFRHGSSPVIEWTDAMANHPPITD